MQVLGIAGTAKNTGKTTTTVAVINQWADSGSLAVTSIGYDGESKDNVTGLPKPRLHVPAGALVVTAERCLEAGSARIERLEKTDTETPLGKLVVGRVRTPGLVVLAGPNNEAALRRFIGKLRELGAALFLVDGALGRLAPMAAADGIVLATGAARTRDLDKLAREMAACADIFGLTSADPTGPRLELGSLLVDKQAAEYAAQAAQYKCVEFTGVADSGPLDLFLKGLEPRRPDLVFRDPVKLMLSQDTTAVAAALRAYVLQGGRVMVRHLLPLRAITVNPFYPAYNEANHQFSPGFVDAGRIFTAVAGAVSVPVVDVVRQGGAELARILKLT